MKSIAYYIDPFLECQGDVFADSWLNALSDLAAKLPACRHIILSTLEVTMEGGGSLEFHKLKVPPKKLFIRSNLKEAIDSFLSQENISIWVTTEPELIASSGQTQTVLIA